LWNVDFSSALENRTGKYFIGCDIISDHRAMIGNIYYWRGRHGETPKGMRARALKLGLKIETRLASLLDRNPLPPRAASTPTLHLDPYSVLHSRIGPEDMVLVHDMGPITHPDLFQPWLHRLYRSAFRKIIGAGARTVFVSAASRDAFIGLYGRAPRMAVIYPQMRAGIRHPRQQPIPGIQGPFLLTVGSLGRRKNQLATIRAFARSGLADRGFSYVICGAREPGADMVEQAAARTTGVHLLPYVSDAELTWLYANTIGFVLVSRLEGFGMPVAEAISHGAIPLVTTASVLEEVAGPAALTARADEEAEIAEVMDRLASMTPAERSSRADAMRQSLGRFTRERFAESWRQELDYVAEC
jgi:glycosyltransferase involved in cell wall biosynthesis